MFNSVVLHELFMKKVEEHQETGALSDFRGDFVLFVRTKDEKQMIQTGDRYYEDSDLAPLFNSITAKDPEEAVYTVGWMNSFTQVGFFLSVMKSQIPDTYKVFVFSHLKDAGLVMLEHFGVTFKTQVDATMEELWLRLCFVQLSNRVSKVKEQLL